MQLVLDRIGVKHVFAAKDGAAAKELLNLMRQNLDMIICDWQMPNMSGHEFLQHVRRDRRGAYPRELGVRQVVDRAHALPPRALGPSGPRGERMSLLTLVIRVIGLQRKRRIAQSRNAAWRMRHRG